MTRDEINQKFDQLYTQSLGKPVKVLPATLNGQQTPQCFDWVVKWTNTLGIPHASGNPSPFPYLHAYQIYTDFGTHQAAYFDRIQTKTFLKGDIVVLDKSVGPSGHVAIAKNSWVTTDQNWNGRGYITEESHNLNSVLGVLRLKVTTSSMDRRPYWFDLINKVTFKKPHEQVTDPEVEKFVKEYPSQLLRSGKWDQLCKLAGITGDTNIVTPEYLYAVLNKTKDAERIKADIIALIQRYKG